ncbi:MAG: hypothetical protein M1153_01380 [Patescibacteria group bacterium]|nr:hypothetical protein [Patescibacteria group bacterium]
MRLSKEYLLPAGILLGVTIAFFVIVKLPYTVAIDPSSTSTVAIVKKLEYPPLDKAAYDAKLLELANLGPAATSTSSTPSLWPVKTVFPNPGAILPFKRIVAYYGNFYSKQMGVLGEYPPDQVLQMLQATASEWQIADPTTPVIPAIDYIAVAAQNNPGPNGLYSLRMPPDQIDKALNMANQVNGLLVLDVQVGQSTVETEVPLLKQYLQQPNVELALDPEFAMYDGHVPGTVIGSLDATDINFAVGYLAKIVQEYNLPPKILIVHRFTQAMVKNYQDIKPLSEVEIVMDMDGFGPPQMKIKTYKDFIASEPVQFTGFKLFFKNDAKNGSHLMTPQEVLKLSPRPSFIQYQ